MNARIAIPFADGEISQHFGSSTLFKLYTIADDKVTETELAETGAIAHDELGLWLIQRGVNAVICGGIGPGALGALTAAGIIALAGVSGEADAAVEKLVAGTLEATSSATCGHAGGCSSHCGGHCGHGHAGCGGCHG